MSRVVVSLLGRFGVETEAGKLSFPTRKTESLLAYLILHPEGIERGRLASIFWPDTEDARARRNLRSTLWRLKRTIGADVPMRLRIIGERVTLFCEGVVVDVLRFKEILRKARSGGEERSELLKSAESLYKGDLLENRLEEWCEEERRLLRSAYMELLKDLAAISKAAGETAVALKYALKVVEMEPLDEDAQRELMILLHLAGRRPEALAQFEVLRQLLNRELGVPPSQATLHVWQHIRSNRSVDLPGSSGVNGNESRTQSESGITPLVGRAGVVSELLHSIEGAAHGRSGAAIILGETGVGKTKLVEAIIVEASLRGFDVLHGQCPDLQNPRPYHVFIQALWQRISDSSRAGTAIPLGVLLRPLMPDSPNGARTGPADSLSGAYDSAIIVEAFLSLFDGGNRRRPTLLVLDDMHRLDGASANLLITLLARLSKLKLFILLTMRSDEFKARTIYSALLAGGAREIQLQPLSQTEIGKLTRLTLRSSSVSATVVKYVWERSNGVPLFAIEFLKYLQTEGLIVKLADQYWVLSARVKTAETSGGIPLRIQEIVKRRIETLDPRVKRVLLTSAIFATEVYFEILEDLVAMPEDVLADALDQLVNLRLLRETGASFQFSHEIIRLVAASMLGRTRLRMMHARVGRLVEHLMPSRVEDLAWHFEMAGDVVKGLAYAEASGDKARCVYANADAAAWYTKALKFHDKHHRGNAGDLRLRASLLQKRQDVLDLLGDRDRQAADIAAIHALARQLGDKRLLAESLNLRANLLIRLNAGGDALNNARLANRYFARIGDDAGVARSCETAGLAYDNLRRYSEASTEFERAQEMFRRLGDKAGEARGLIHIAVSLSYSNRNISALRCLGKARRLLKTLADHRNLALVFLQQGILYRYLGQLGTSESLMLRGISIFREMGDRVGEARVLGQLAVTHTAMGQIRRAVHECEAALRIARQAGDVRALIMTLNNSAYGVYRLTGGFSRAQRYVREALRLVSEAGNIENSALYVDTMAGILLDAGHPKEALRWARRSEARYAASGLRSWLGIDIYMRLGAILAKLGRPREAQRSFQRARRHLGRNTEPGTQLLIATEMAGIFLELGNLRAAAEYEKRISELLRQVDGVERIQNVYWTQFRVLKGTDREGAAVRALRRAATVIIRQAVMLKKPMRRRFLAMPLNSRILREFWGSNRSLGTLPSTDSGAEEIISMFTEYLGAGSSDLVSPIGPLLDSIVAARRRVVLALIQKERVKQREIAGRLGVSVRTVRNDITRLRKQGLLKARLAN